ncbi:ribonuclease HII [Fulvimarina endophytica]|uniref:Ribonuclease HII n=1 Tax=Fulvimarina endophytica TaxID=2293836 RepID=A0A371X253_9HYPH|nr:ribonuclease HII [Fulvimarina endophytica]RFC63300.1 ribonuclease HII [Fulvimarina endophytica]
MPAAGRKAKSRARPLPDFTLEAQLLTSGERLVAGIDEVGRGPLAGPVVCAAVIFEAEADLPDGLDDSKRLTAARRDRLHEEILRRAHVAIAAVPAAIIDRINIRQATLLAMTQAVERLPVRPSHCLFDGREVPEPFRDIGTAIVGGDRLSASIAAASIVAKVSRDRMMLRADRLFPGYGFATNMGYGAPIHLATIAEQGPTPIHRMSFRPLSAL